MNRSYTIDEAKLVLEVLHDCGYLNASVIGSLKSKGVSNHDIDILIPIERPTRRIKEQIASIFAYKKLHNTDWGGIYLEGTQYGDIDIFFTTKYFNY